jgi:acetyltransferase
MTIRAAPADVDLCRLFDPRRILFVGASETSLFSASIPRYLLDHGFGDRLVMVNDKGKTVYGQPTVRTIADAASHGPFDLAVVIIPAPAVPPAIEELCRIGCRLVIVESAGFAEVGGPGVALQQALKETAAACGVRVLGPNCVGVIDTASRFCTTAVLDESLTPGGVALVAQSGVFGSIMLDTALRLGLRFSKAITLGNRVDLNEADFLYWLADDPATRVVAMYLEGVADGRRFLDAARACVARKPVLVLKGGRTAAGAKAVGSHTASLAGADAVFTGALRQAGAVRVDSLDHLIDAARVFDLAAPRAGRRVGVVTTSGSQGILATDVLTAHGLELAAFSDATLARIREQAPAWMPIGNPLDVGPSHLYATGIEALANDPQVDAVLIIIAIPWQAIRPAVEAGMPVSALLGDLGALREAAARKPIVVSHIGYAPFVDQVAAAVGSFLPVYPNSERAARALATHYRHYCGLQIED